jgi:hypothetical protein
VARTKILVAEDDPTIADVVCGTWCTTGTTWSR